MDEALAYETIRKDGAQRYFVHGNHLYSPAALTDAAGAVVERMNYDAYGRQIVTAVDGTHRGRSSVGFDRGFTGFISDQETGLMYARARMYSPGVCRRRRKIRPLNRVDPWFRGGVISGHMVRC